MLIFETIIICEKNPEISHMTEINKYTACDFYVFAKFAHDLKINNISIVDQITLLNFMKM